MIESRKWICDSDRKEYDSYMRQVINHTEQSYKNYKHIINPNNLLRNGKDFELDHKFSKHKGFLENVSPEVIGHWTNLEMVSAHENNSKWTDCSITLTDLLENYDKFKH